MPVTVSIVVKNQRRVQLARFSSETLGNLYTIWFILRPEFKLVRRASLSYVAGAGGRFFPTYVALGSASSSYSHTFAVGSMVLRECELCGERHGVD